jgi:hypothetical protein
MVYWSITDFKKTNVRFPRTKDLYKKIKKNLAPRSSVRQPELSSVVFLSIENRVRQLILTEATEESMNHKYIENWMSQKANLHMYSLFGQPKTGLKNN